MCVYLFKIFLLFSYRFFFIHFRCFFFARLFNFRDSFRRSVRLVRLRHSADVLLSLCFVLLRFIIAARWWILVAGRRKRCSVAVSRARTQHANSRLSDCFWRENGARCVSMQGDSVCRSQLQSAHYNNVYVKCLIRCLKLEENVVCMHSIIKLSSLWEQFHVW